MVSLMKSEYDWEHLNLRCLLPHLLLSPPLAEHQPKQAHPATQVLWTVLCSGRRQKHPYCGDEQSLASYNPNAPQIRPEGLHV